MGQALAAHVRKTTPYDAQLALPAIFLQRCAAPMSHCNSALFGSNPLMDSEKTKGRGEGFTVATEDIVQGIEG